MDVAKNSIAFKKLAFWQLIIVATLILCLTSVPFAFFIKIFVNLLAPGRSNFKIILLLSYLFLLVSLRYFKPLRISQHLPLFNLLFAFGIFALGAIEHFSLLHYLGEDFTSRLVFQDGIKLSSTHFQHIHTGKVVLGKLVQVLPFIPLQQYDYGKPFLNYFPAWLVIFHCIAYITFFYTTIKQLRSYDRFSLGVYVLFSLSCFVILRDQLDGGIFSMETLSALPIYACMQWRLWRKPEVIISLLNLWLPILAIELSILAILFHFYWLPHNWLEDRPMSTAIVSLVLLSLYAIFNAIEKRHQLRAMLITMLSANIIFFVHYSNIYNIWGIQQFTYIMQKIDTVFTAYATPEVYKKAIYNQNFIINHINTVGDIKLLDATPKKPLSLWQLKKEWNLYINYAAVDVHTAANCKQDVPYITKGYIYITGASPSLRHIKKNYGNIIFELQPDARHHRYPSYSLVLSVPGCTPDHIELLKHILTDVGIHKSIMKLDDFVV